MSNLQLSQYGRLPAPWKRVLPAAACALLALVPVAGAAPHAEPGRESVKDPHRVHVCFAPKGEVTLLVDGSQLEVTSRDGEHVKTTVIDMDEVGRLVGDAVGEAMAAMDELQMQVRLGQDNRIDITTAEGMVQVDLDAIMSQVAAAVQVGLDGIDTASWATAGPRDEAELQRELADLQEEMRALREELRRLRDSAAEAPAARR